MKWINTDDVSKVDVGSFASVEFTHQPGLSAVTFFDAELCEVFRVTKADYGSMVALIPAPREKVVKWKVEVVLGGREIVEVFDDEDDANTFALGTSPDAFKSRIEVEVDA